MKYFLFLLFSLTLFAQEYPIDKDVSVYEDDYTVLSFEIAGDVSSDSLVFGVKPDRLGSTDRVLQKENAAGGGSDSEIEVIYGSKSTVLVKIYSTDVLNPAIYYYDLTKDSTTIFTGAYKVRDDVTGLADGVATRTPYYTVALDTPNVANTFLIGQDSTNIWYRRTVAATRTILGIDTITNATSLPDSIIYTSETADFVTKSTTQTVTAQKNFMGTVKFRADTSFQFNPAQSFPTVIGITQPSASAGKYNIFRATCNDTNNAPYVSQLSYADFIPDSAKVDFLYTTGYNVDGTKPNEPAFSINMESPYEVNANYDAYEWFISFADKYTGYTYYSRPIQMSGWIPKDGVSPTYTAVNIAADQFYISGYDGWQKLRLYPQPEGTTSQLVLMDSTYLFQEVNNIPFLLQASTLGGSVELMRIDGDNEVKISPNGTTKIKLFAPLNGSIKWRNNAENDFITILPDSNDRLNIVSAGGVGVQSLDINYIPDDTTGLVSGKIYIDPNNGDVKYTIPENLVTNGDFSTWGTCGTYECPSDWVYPDTTLGVYVEQSPSGRAHIISDGTSTAQFYWNNVLQIPGTTYGYSFTVYEPVDSFNVFMTGWSDEIKEAGTYTGEWTSTDAGSLVSFASSIGTTQEITVDNIKVWIKNGAAKQTLIEIHNLPYVNNFLNPTTDDTLGIFLTDKALEIDSIKFRVDDSIGVKLTYGALGLGTTILDSDTLVSGWQTITSFADATVEASNEVYLYFTYIGDTATFIRWKIYWRE